jgi:hypothetical protein
MTEKEIKIMYIPFGRLRPHTQALYEKHYDYVEAETAKHKNVNGSQRWFCKDCQKQLSVGSQVSIRRHLCSKKHLEIVGLLTAEEAANIKGQGRPRKPRQYVLFDSI